MKVKKKKKKKAFLCKYVFQNTIIILESVNIK